MPAVPSRRWTLVAAAIGGLALDTAFPARSWWPLAYVAVALLLLALRRGTLPWAGLVGFVFGLGFYLPHLWWAVNAVGGEPIGWVALSVAQAVAVGGFAVAWTIVRRGRWIAARTWVQPLAVAVLWVAMEQVKGRWPFGGFPWGALAFSQNDAPIVHLAPVGGTPLVSGAVVVVGALLALAWNRRREAGVATAAAVGALGVAAAPWLIPLESRAEAGTLLVGAVQGNVPTQGADAMSQARAVADNHAAGTEALLERIAPGELDLVLWPESASDIDPRTDAGVAARIDEAARAVDAPVLLGTQRFFPEVRYNDYVLWEPGSGGSASYTKQHPVPFGEYMPHRDFFRQFTDAVDLVGTDMGAGTEVALLPVPVERLGRDVGVTTGICFEVVYDDIVREGVRAGGELIVIPTNNASYGFTQESTQQFAMSRFRAVEHGRAVVQVSTVGVSGVVSPNGVVQDSTGLFTAEQMVERVPLRTSLTLAARLGEWPGWLAMALAAVLLAARVVAPHRQPPPRRRTGTGGSSPGRAGSPTASTGGRGAARTSTARPVRATKGAR